MYNKPFSISANVGNNSFSFDKRKKPELWVTGIVDGQVNSVRTGDKIAFEDFDSTSNLKSCVGLEHFIRTEHPATKKPVIIVDNHNHVFYFWHEARSKGLIKNGATLIHIDQHKDTRKPDKFLTKKESEDMQKVFEYTNFVLNVGNYLPPAIEDGLIGEIISITSEMELKSHKSLIVNRKSLIVNIDLDFWSPEMSYIDNELKNNVTRKLMEKADLITIATSPFFIDQKLGIKVLKELFMVK
jgi:hypothetical protein